MLLMTAVAGTLVYAFADLTPHVDQQNRLVGIISMNDLVARAECRRGAELPGEEFLETLKAICEHSGRAVTA